MSEFRDLWDDPYFQKYASALKKCDHLVDAFCCKPGRSNEIDPNNTLNLNDHFDILDDMEAAIMCAPDTVLWEEFCKKNSHVKAWRAELSRFTEQLDSLIPFAKRASHIIREPIKVFHNVGYYAVFAVYDEFGCATYSLYDAVGSEELLSLKPFPEYCNDSDVGLLLNFLSDWSPRHFEMFQAGLLSKFKLEANMIRRKY